MRPARNACGFTLLELLVAVSIITVLAGLTVSAVQKVRHAAVRSRCQNQLRQIAVASHGYHAAHQSLPPATSYMGGGDPYPYMGWAARLLPFLDQSEAWRQATAAFAAERDFVIAPPHTLARVRMVAYLCPLEVFAHSGPDDSGFALTSYLGVSGARSRSGWDGVMYIDSRTRLTDVTDGTSNTLFYGERPPSGARDLGWWYGGWGQRKDGSGDASLSVRETNYYANAGGCARGPYQFAAGRSDNQCDAFHFWSLHPGGANFALCDGSVRFLAYSADSVLPALATRAGGEVTEIP